MNLSEHKRFSAEKMAKNNLFDTPRMFCDLYCFEPGQEQRRHSHENSDKVYVVVEGQARITIGGEERDLKPGEAALVPPRVEHGVVNSSSQKLAILVFMTPKT